MGNVKLSADEIQRIREAHLGRLLLQSARQHHQAVVDGMNALGFQIRATHASVIRHVHINGSRVTDVADRAGMTKQAVGQILIELERAGYVRCTIAPRDRRVKTVMFTDKGLRFAAAIGSAVKQADVDFARRIGRPRLRLLYTLLHRVLENGATRRRRGG